MDITNQFFKLIEEELKEKPQTYYMIYFKDETDLWLGHDEYYSYDGKFLDDNDYYDDNIHEPKIYLDSSYFDDWFYESKLVKKLFDNGYWWSTPSNNYTVNQNALYFVVTNVLLYCNEYNLPYPYDIRPEWRCEIYSYIDSWGIIDNDFGFYDYYNKNYINAYNKYKNFNIQPNIISKLQKYKSDDDEEIETIIKAQKEKERKKMTPSLRYNILKRDNFKCCLCGRSAKDGVQLEVDHIIPIAKGGKTEPSNLRTLCFDCNRGKGIKIE